MNAKRRNYCERRNGFCPTYRRLSTWRMIERLEAENKRLWEVLDDLASCMTGVIEGDYTPDSFTLQPAREALAATEPKPMSLDEIHEQGLVSRYDMISEANNYEG